MGPIVTAPPKFGHDVDGNLYKLKYNDQNEEISRTPTGEKVIWTGGVTANFGIKKFKKEARNRQGSAYMINIYKENSWKVTEMKDLIAKTALKSIKKKTKKVLDKTV